MDQGIISPPVDAAARGAVDLRIGGMSCAACVRRVERALLGVPGVVGAEVNLATERARIRRRGCACPAGAIGGRRAAGRI